MSNLTADLDARLVVQDVIQRVYGDATQTTLDCEAATEIVRALRGMGWASLDDVGMLIEAVGGEITVPHRVLANDRERRVTVQDDYATGKKFRVSVART